MNRSFGVILIYLINSLLLLSFLEFPNFTRIPGLKGTNEGGGVPVGSPVPTGPRRCYLNIGVILIYTDWSSVDRNILCRRTPLNLT
jgi:hypothetical protein